jgi:hypothetical protein
VATKLRPSLSLAEGEEDLSTPGVTDYTGPRPATSFRDKSGRDVTITDTDMAPYMANPDMAQMEADVAKARYGGSSIQDSKQTPFKQPPAGEPGAVQQFPPRSVFEKSIFNTLKSESNPTGNPFDMNVPAMVEKISRGDLPDLFNQVFNGTVIWEDRHLLDDEQKKLWLEEAKRYRAHLKDQVTAEKQTATGQYNQLMTRFDNEKKEHEAALKAVQAKTAKFAKEQKADKKEVKTEKAAAIKRKSELLKEIATLTTKLTEREAKGEQIYPEEQEAFRAQVEALRQELQGVKQQLGQGDFDMTKHGELSSSGADVHESKKLQGKKGKDAVGPGKKVTPGKKKADTVVKPIEKEKKIKRTGMHKGRRVIEYEDGSIEYDD